MRTDLHPLVTVARMTGARVSAITGLRWTDIDLDAGILGLREPGAATRRFPINAEMPALLPGLPRAETLLHGATS